MDRIGASLMVSCVVAAILLIALAWRAWRWHRRGEGERAARSEYVQLRHERVDTAEARLTEAEFVRYRVSLRPGPFRYVLAALVLLLVGLPGACTLSQGWPWN